MKIYGEDDCNLLAILQYIEVQVKKFKIADLNKCKKIMQIKHNI